MRASHRHTQDYTRGPQLGRVLSVFLSRAAIASQPPREASRLPGIEEVEEGKGEREGSSFVKGNMT